LASLRDTISRLEQDVQATGEAVWEWDLAENLVWHNTGYRSILGADTDRALTFASWSERLHPADRERVEGSLHAAATSGDSWSESYRLRRNDGSYAHVLDHCMMATGGDGVSARMIGTIRDITDLAES